MISGSLIFIGISILIAIYKLPKIFSNSPYVRNMTQVRLKPDDTRYDNSDAPSNNFCVIVDPETRKYKTVVRKSPHTLR